MSRDVGFTLSILVLMLASGTAYQLSGERQWYTKSARLAFKGLTTFFACILALFAYAQTGQQYALVMAFGILLCAIADVLLEINFLWGTGCFAAGHVLYLVSFIQRRPPGLPSFVLFVVLALTSTTIMLRFRKQVEFNLLPFYAYSLIIGGMVAVALAQHPLVFLGAALFAVSDAIIARRLLFPKKNPWDRACILLYYLAQFTLAATLLI